MKKFKVGGLVKVKRTLKAGRQYGRIHFITEMEKYRGQTIKLEGATGDAFKISDQIGDDVYFYYFSPEMLKPVKKFKIGDWVTVKKSLEVDRDYGLYLFTKAMENLKGKTFTVSRAHDGLYMLESVPDLGFTHEMLKPAINPKIKAAFKALKKLARLVKPVGPTDYYYYVLRARSNENRIFITLSKTPTLLSFETLEKAQKFRRKYRDLLEIAKPLL